MVVGQHCAGGEIDAHPNDVVCANPALPQHGRNGLLESADVILGILQSPFGPEAHGRALDRELLIDHAVRVGIDRAADFPSGLHFHQNSPPRFGAKINPDGIFLLRRRLCVHRSTFS